MLSINTNLQSLIAQNSLKTSTNKLNTSIERMTTGFKINGAKDNAANYSIAANMSTQIGAYEIADDNASMALNMVMTGDETLSLISDKLARLRALATQAANGTYGKQSLKAINAEAAAIINEIYRVKNSAEYNGKNIFGDSPIDSGTVGASGLEVNEQGFLQDVKTRDTSEMTSLACVNETAVLAKGTYSISSADELAKLSRMQNAGKVTAGSEFVLGADIDLSEYTTGEGFTPIGGGGRFTGGSNLAFSGTFDGNGYIITNLYINKPSNACISLFGCTKDAVIKNLGVDGVELKGSNCTAALVSYNYDGGASLSIENCFAKNINIYSIFNSSGLVGTGNNFKANIDYCYVEGEISGESQQSAGIICAAYELNISNCFSNVNLSSNTDYYVGGIVANTSGNVCNINNCFSLGNIDSSSAKSAGGIIGNPSYNAIITNCHSSMNITAQKTGGISGDCGSGIKLIENCYATGNLKGTIATGGIVGMYDKGGEKMSNSHFVGKVSGLGSSGSLIGDDKSHSYTIKDCTYNGGNPLGTTSEIPDGAIDISNNKFFQIGIYGNEESQINFNSCFVLGELKDLIAIGIQNSSALGIIDKYVAKVSEQQVSFGAVQNRLESALEEVSTHYENLSSSRSTLRDADIAEVSSEYIMQQILQQASATLMATANQSPALALQLL